MEDFSYEDQLLFCCAASDIFDSHAAGQYIVPLQEWAYDVRIHVAALAAWYLISKRGFNTEGTNQHFLQRHDQALAWMEAVSRGAVTLSGGLKIAQEPLGGPEVFSSPKRGW
jgi:phage gp36-like protein